MQCVHLRCAVGLEGETVWAFLTHVHQKHDGLPDLMAKETHPSQNLVFLERAAIWFYALLLPASVSWARQGAGFSVCVLCVCVLHPCMG